MTVGRFNRSRVRASRIERGLRVIREHVAESDAVAFVHAGSDADSAYLGVEGIVVTPDHAVGLVERGDDAQSVSVREMVVRAVDDPAGSVVDVVDELVRETGETRERGETEETRERGETEASGIVLTPRAVRHDVALFLERAGYELVSTTAVADARVEKTSSEHTAVRQLGTVTTAGIDTAVERLAATSVDDGVLWSRTDDGANAPLTGEDLSRGVATTLAGHGVETPGVRVCGVGTGESGLPAGRPVVVECHPVAPGGIQLHAACTLVVDGDGGWERRAQLALDAAHRAGRGKLSAVLDGETVTVGEVAVEVRAEVTAYGFEETTVTVHGVGQSARERPQGGEQVERGQLLIVGASVTRTGDKTVSESRRADVVTHVETLLLGEAVERLVSLPTSLSPSRALER